MIVCPASIGKVIFIIICSQTVIALAPNIRKIMPVADTLNLTEQLKEIR